jgi:hypothetical protein
MAAYQFAAWMFSWMAGKLRSLMRGDAQATKPPLPAKVMRVINQVAATIDVNASDDQALKQATRLLTEPIRREEVDLQSLLPHALEAYVSMRKTILQLRAGVRDHLEDERRRRWRYLPHAGVLVLLAVVAYLAGPRRFAVWLALHVGALRASGTPLVPTASAGDPPTQNIV